MSLSISKIRSTISEYKTPVVVAALTVGIYLKSELVKRAFENLAEYMKSSLFDHDKIDIKEEIRIAHQKIDEDLARKNKLAKKQLEFEIAEIDAKFEIAEGKRKADFRKRSEEFDRETEEKLRKIRAEGNEMKKKWKEDNKRLEKEIAILNELWKKYEDVIKENCPKENPAIFQNMSDAERILDKRLEPECCGHARILLFSNSYNGSYYTFKELDALARKLKLKIHPDKNEKNLDYGSIFSKLEIAIDILKLCRNEEGLYELLRKTRRYKTLIEKHPDEVSIVALYMKNLNKSATAVSGEVGW